MVFSDIFGSCNWVSKKIRKLYDAKIKIGSFSSVFQFHWHFLSWVAGQNTQTQNTRAQNTQTQNTQAQNTQTQNTQSPKLPKSKIPKYWSILGTFDVQTLLVI